MFNIHRNKKAPHLRSYGSLAIASSLLLLSFVVSADHKLFKTGQGVVIHGFDPVAYFTMGKPELGSKDIIVEWLGSTWRLVNEENKSLFLANPGKYLPQYGGYCAKAVSRGKRHVQTDVGSWKIVDGKLYLFRDKANMSGWYADDPRVVRAEKRWEKAKVDLLGQ